jgi:hypothetical protein
VLLLARRELEGVDTFFKPPAHASDRTGQVNRKLLQLNSKSTISFTRNEPAVGAA